MILDGRAISESILESIATTVKQSVAKGITPTLAVILVGNDAGSLSYIKQKQKTGDRVGIRVLFEHLSESISPEVLASTIAHYNADPAVHGVIIQRPVPTSLGEIGDILQSVSHAKDVDGFLPNSPFETPVAKAVLAILNTAHTDLVGQHLIHAEFLPWLQSQKITIIGRGETAGKPIATLLSKYNCATSIVHSQSTDPKTQMKQASIVISCVGKPNTITKSCISRGVLLISVGLSRDSAGKLHGDYETEEIGDIASFYTPTPGGVGPVNVACLMQNVIDATILQIP